jgi:predicted DNA-binding transcriptional regulator YafY
MERSEKLAALAAAVRKAKGERVTARTRFLSVSPANIQACADAETVHAATREHYLVALESYFALAERVRMSGGS